MSTTTVPQRARKQYRYRDTKLALLMLAPVVILLSIFVIWPAVYAVYLSFQNWSFYKDPEFVGWKNFRDVLTDPPPHPVTLIVVDGTWSNAKTLVRDSTVLSALPRVAFAAPRPTEYRIRREPRDEYVSTIEALVHVLVSFAPAPQAFACEGCTAECQVID